MSINLRKEIVGFHAGGISVSFLGWLSQRFRLCTTGWGGGQDGLLGTLGVWVNILVLSVRTVWTIWRNLQTSRSQSFSSRKWGW